MKQIKKLFLVLLVALFISPSNNQVLASESNQQIDVHFFHSETCLGCAEMESWFNEEILTEYTDINIIYYDIALQENLDLMNQVAETFNHPGLTPTIAIGGVGFYNESNKTKAEIKGLLNYYADNDYVDITQKLINHETILESDFDNLEEIVNVPNVITIPIIGDVQVDNLSTIIFAILVGFTDGLNPCAMWILVFLLSMLISMHDKKRMWIIGFTFLLTSAILYGFVMVLMSEAFVTFNQFGIFRYIVSLFSIIFGIYLIYKYFKSRQEDDGCEVIDDKKRKTIIHRIQNIVKSDKLFVALIATVVLAVSVNLVELACTAALPAGFVSMLSIQNYTFIQRLGYIGVYVFFFLLDDLIIFTIALISMQITGISNKLSKISNIIGGILMLVIGVLLLFSII